MTTERLPQVHRADPTRQGSQLELPHTHGHRVARLTLSDGGSSVLPSPEYCLATVANSYFSCSAGSSRIASFLTGGSFESWGPAVGGPRQQPRTQARSGRTAHPLRLGDSLLRALDVERERVAGRLEVLQAVLVCRADGAPAVVAAQADVHAERTVLVVKALRALQPRPGSAGPVMRARSSDAHLLAVDWLRRRRGA